MRSVSAAAQDDGHEGEQTARYPECIPHRRLSEVHLQRLVRERGAIMRGGSVFHRLAPSSGLARDAQRLQDQLLITPANVVFFSI